MASVPKKVNTNGVDRPEKMAGVNECEAVTSLNAEQKKKRRPRKKKNQKGLNEFINEFYKIFITQ